MLNLPRAEREGTNKCSKLLSNLLSNQAESTSKTMKVLGNLLKDDGCSLNEQEKVVASKLLGQMANGMATYSKFTLLTIKQKTTKNSSIDYEHAI